MIVKSSSVSFWVGTYTTPASHVPGAKGKGILRGSMNLGTGEIHLTVAAPDAPDSSYLAVSKSHLFAVVEKPTGEGEFHVYLKGAEGGLKLKARHPSGGLAPCHLAAIGDEVVLAHYGGDRLQIFRPGSGGEWTRREVGLYRGSGPVASRQDRPHLHQVVHLAEFGQIAVCDLGSDRIWLHRTTDSGVEATPSESLKTPPGSGPRHAVYAPESRSFYVLGELSGKVVQYRRHDEEWMWKAEWPTLPESTQGGAGAAIKLHPTGKALYVSERTTSKVFVFRVEHPTGELDLAGVFASGGESPREIAVDPTGKWLIALNQDSGSMVTFGLDPVTGLPTGDEGEAVECETPVCLLFDSFSD